LTFDFRLAVLVAIARLASKSKTSLRKASGNKLEMRSASVRVNGKQLNVTPVLLADLDKSGSLTLDLSSFCCGDFKPGSSLVKTGSARIAIAFGAG
jgi:hypothetical protein